ncbi:hypothetical protein evm_002540 [Chilo suppressalis]|nr:hypothetical protein evm_002540 [Chilo suppressalis]
MGKSSGGRGSPMETAQSEALKRKGANIDDDDTVPQAKQPTKFVATRRGLFKSFNGNAIEPPLYFCRVVPTNIINVKVCMFVTQSLKNDETDLVEICYAYMIWILKILFIPEILESVIMGVIVLHLHKLFEKALLMLWSSAREVGKDLLK